MNIKKLCQVIVLKSQFAVFLPLIFISALFWVFSSIYGLTETIDTGGALKNSFKPPAKNLTSKNTLPMFEAPPVERFNLSKLACRCREGHNVPICGSLLQ